MKILKSIAVAFSMYSKIPMPRFEWASSDMKYHLIFFPWIGAVIAGLEFLFKMFADAFALPKLVFTLIAVAIPLIVTGGFHLDGYMDTSDALSSYQSREKRLEILKDPHIGAFSVIRLCTYGLVLIAAVYSMDNRAFYAWICMFFVARAVSGICVIRYKKAKTSGLLKTEADTAADKIVVILLGIQTVVVAIIAGVLFSYTWDACLAALVVAILYYVYTAYTKFGGITGDLAGWFLCIAELWSGVAVALFTIIFR